MTVAELIAKLQAFEPGLPVCVDGYEGGVTEKINPVVIEVAVNVNTKDYYGEHESVRSVFNNPNAARDHVLVLSRYDEPE